MPTNRVPQGLLDELIHFVAELSHATWSKILLSIVVALIVWGVRRLLLRVVERRSADPSQYYRWRKGTAYGTMTLMLVLLMALWIDQFKSVGTFLGLVSAGLAIALKDLVTSIAGWLFILFRKPFAVGDRIKVGPHAGDVIDLRLFKFSLMEINEWVAADQSTGRVIHLPNSLVLSSVLLNYSGGFQFIWNELPVRITFDSSWRRAKHLLQEIAEKHTLHFSRDAESALQEAAHRYFIHYSRLTPIVYVSIEPDAVLLTIRHLCPPRQRRGVEAAIWEEILQRFGESRDIQWAYPTQRLFGLGPAATSAPGDPPASTGSSAGATADPRSCPPPSSQPGS